MAFARELELKWGPQGVRFFCRRTGTEGLPCPSASSFLAVSRGPDALECIWNEPPGWEVVFVVGVHEECKTLRASEAFGALQRARSLRLPALVLAPFPQGAHGLDASECAPWLVWVGRDEHRVRVELGAVCSAEWKPSEAELALERAFSQAQLETRAHLPAQAQSPVLHEAFQKLVAHEHAGDCYLANLTATVPLTLAHLPAASGHARLGSEALPSPALHLERVLARGVRFGAHAISTSGHGVLLSSPERFLRVVEGCYVFAEPIKGTSLCSIPPRADEAQALWSSTKETAELVLVTDLLRNDLNLVCEPGSVHVHNPFFLRDAGGLLQMQSTVFGTLREDSRFVEKILKATLPAGSVSGTPKKRVRELLMELETSVRGFYTGVFGLLDSTGEFDSAVCIRSIFSDARGLGVGVGAGVTSLSDPDAECEELRWKLDAVARFWRGAP